MTEANAAGQLQGFDPARLEAWLSANIPGFVGPLAAEKFPGGQSNPTYRLVTPLLQYVMRRKPPGKLMAGAHAVDREYRIISALGGQGFPVPKAYGHCTDAAVIGTEFFIMELVEGRIFWDPAFREVPRPERAAYFAAMNETLAQLHGIDYAAAGLGDYGKPGNYFARQIARWVRAYKEDTLAGPVVGMDELCDWLPDNIPPGDETSLVHGDYRCDNMIFHPTEPRVVAVLDWELSTLGHPLADFTYHLMMYRTPQGLPAGMAGLDPVELGLPTEAAYVAQYCHHTGRASIPALDFYIAFNLFRFAAIIHGIKGRLLRGNASSAHASQMVSRLDELGACAWEQAQRAQKQG